MSRPVAGQAQFQFPTAPGKMKALEWRGNKSVALAERDVPELLDERDALLRVTTTTVCGSDLHLYHHEFSGLSKGDILGHEFMGVVQRVGSGVKNIQAGDRVVCSFLISCGSCYYCKQGLFSCCDCTNPSKEMEELYGHRISGCFGYSHLTGGYLGGQAEYVRVPFADVNMLKIPGDIPDEKVLLLSDVMCTGWHANECGGVSPGQTVAVWGCGPVGIMSLALAKFRGASRIIAIDGEPYRLDFARQKLGAEIIDFSKQSDVVKALQQLVPNGPDVCIDAVGFRFPKSLSQKFQRALHLETDTPEVLREAISTCKKGGTISIVGDYYNVANAFPIGPFMEKSLMMRGGQSHVQRYWKILLDYIVKGEFDPSFLFTHILPFEQIVDAYRMFDNHENGVMKVVLKTAFGMSLAQEMGTAIFASAPALQEAARHAEVRQLHRHSGKTVDSTLPGPISAPIVQNQLIGEQITVTPIVSQVPVQIDPCVVASQPFVRAPAAAAAPAAAEIAPTGERRGLSESSKVPIGPIAQDGEQKPIERAREVRFGAGSTEQQQSEVEEA